MTVDEKKKLCAGCENDRLNRPGATLIGCCPWLPSMRFVTDSSGAMVPKCYFNTRTKADVLALFDKAIALE